MTKGFRSFVIFAGMRTGSNLLEATLNTVTGVTCFGEAFNPYMMGWPDKDEMLGITRAAREADPLALLARLTDRPGHLPGFRYFHDHDPRVLEPIIADRRCAKIVLTRNPLDSYVSTRLAQDTNQWKLNATETPIPARITYDGDAFRGMLAAADAFRRDLSRRLQATGQTAFHLDYDDLRDGDVLTGLLHWLGRTDLDRVEPARDQVPQNPQELAQKVANFDAMQADLAGIDPFGLHRIPSFEPRRGPAVPGFAASDAGRGLLFMPVRGGPGHAVRDWLARLGPTAGGFTQSTLRQWKRARPGHRSFSVLRHPLVRAWDAFDHLLTRGSSERRDLLRRLHRVALPPEDGLPGLTGDARIAAFAEFLGFLRRNLNGQTSLPTHPLWASQTEILAGFARLAVPDMLAREDRLAEDLHHLAHAAGIEDARLETLEPAVVPDALRDRTLIDAAQAAYLRDYVAFGFDPMP
ncbi:hypothetical protein EYF88_03350 [Paracoccus sediminis]|uniref:LPS sulfotransferase NodH n=1 Tax=Paracoccus sediminis TaxID=1214787 RepID=A0A238VDI8_9RHOB|nr:hypothetical protein [Paracoccus sediminis]TBN51944.1 hypothetical protein EYF88_03350 [Paracoccus sediminis]SNR32316.1 hypothetical protein SAMN06265378_10247 [Paracoccus sediminis]